MTILLQIAFTLLGKPNVHICDANLVLSTGTDLKVKLRVVGCWGVMLSLLYK
jgi:hypothetical protein